MKRNLACLQDKGHIWDIVIIGGGATGLGCGVEAASRGYRTLLLEQNDFAKGTSSRSTKLIHGGVRYLKQGNVALVREALQARGLLIQNAPHIVKPLPLIVPHYRWWERPFYGTGLKVYDLLAGKLNLAPSKQLSRQQTLKQLPTLARHGLKGGTLYYDAQFDDARLAVSLAQTMAELQGVPLNYVKVNALLKAKDRICGVVAEDTESGQRYEVQAKVVINATGVFSDHIQGLDDPNAPKLLSVSQGVHVVLGQDFLPGQTALMVPRTEDGRVLFAIPWHGRVLVGTTDTHIPAPSLEPRSLQEEIDFLLDHAACYLTQTPKASDVLSVFAGLRPLVRNGTQRTSSLSRKHNIFVSKSGLLTITGGKWTTYRNMGQDTIDRAAALAKLPPKLSTTTGLRLHGWVEGSETVNQLSAYGSDAKSICSLIQTQSELGQPLHPELSYLKAHVAWAVRQEMAQTVEDVLSRRIRALLLDAKASIEMAPQVAHMMADELNKDTAWIQKQISDFTQVAQGYLLPIHQ